MNAPHPSDGRSGEGQLSPSVASVAADQSFRWLVRDRRRFARIGLTAVLLWFFIFLFLAGFAPLAMATPILGSLTFAYALGLSQFVLVWSVVAAYLRRSTRVYAPLERRVLTARKKDVP